MQTHSLLNCRLKHVGRSVNVNLLIILTASFYHGLYAKQRVILGEVERRNYGDTQNQRKIKTVSTSISKLVS